MRTLTFIIATVLAISTSPAFAKHGGSPAPGHQGDTGQGHGKAPTGNPGGVGGPPGHHSPDSHGHPNCCAG